MEDLLLYLTIPGFPQRSFPLRGASEALRRAARRQRDGTCISAVRCADIAATMRRRGIVGASLPQGRTLATATMRPFTPCSTCPLTPVQASPPTDLPVAARSLPAPVDPVEGAPLPAPVPPRHRRYATRESLRQALIIVIDTFLKQYERTGRSPTRQAITDQAYHHVWPEGEFLTRRQLYTLLRDHEIDFDALVEERRHLISPA